MAADKQPPILLLTGFDVFALWRQIIVKFLKNEAYATLLCLVCISQSVSLNKLACVQAHPSLEIQQ